MHREHLAADRGGTREQDGLVGALDLGDDVIDGLVVQLRVVVVHQLGFGAVIVDHVVNRDAFAEVGLEAVHALVHQVPELVLVPAGGLRVGEVHNAHAGLPLVPLPDLTVPALDQVALGGGFGEQRRLLADVRVDPHAHLQAAVVQLLEQTFRIGELIRIPLEVAPFEFLHPTAVEVEHGQRDVAFGHAVHELHDGLLVVVGGEGGAQPQAVAPVRNQRRFAGQVGVGVEDVLQVFAADHRVGHFLAGYGELYAGDLLGTDLEADAARVVHEQTVLLVGQIERDVLVRLFGAGAAVLVPDIDGLAVLDEVGEAFAQTVDLLADAEVELFGDVQAALVVGDERLGTPSGVGDDAAVIRVGEVDGLALGDGQRGLAGGEGPGLIGFGDLDVRVALVELELRAVAAILDEVHQTGGDDVRTGAGDLDGQDAAVKRLPGVVDRHAERAEQRELLRFDPGLVDVGRVLDAETILDEPATIQELHYALL